MQVWNIFGTPGNMSKCMERKYPVIAVMLCLAAPGLLGQSGKTIKEKGIASMTVHEYFLDEGMDTPVIESIERYNEEGDLTEIKELNKRGEVTRWERYVYDAEGRLVEETFLDEKGDTIRIEKTIYREDLRVEKDFYDQRGRLFKRKEYIYEYHR